MMAGDPAPPTDASRFCPHCGHEMIIPVIAGEPRNHWYCERCREPYHEHPMIVVTAFIAHQKSLLWVRRAIEPQRGCWAIPGGFMEQGETLREAAARELREEAGVTVDPATLELYMMGTLTFINQVYMGFRAAVDTPAFTPGPESLECAFFTRDQCPWDEVAYPQVNDAIQQAYEDLERGEFAQWHVEMTGEKYDRRPIYTGPVKLAHPSQP